ncbi:MAG: hypothetical protein LBQ18_04950 [Campylobacteraceae bacterium]|jgi:hypothetical protein|nr:hypothetical protein [Campylobacteraceae bacterium]
MFGFLTNGSIVNLFGKSFGKFVSILFASLLIAGCGGSGDDDYDDDDNVRTTPIYTVSFYDENLTLLGTKSANSSTNVVSLSEYGRSVWYASGGAANKSGNFALNGNTNLYAVPDVTEIIDQEGLNNVRNNLAGKYILFNDIALESNGTGWNPIGEYESPFSGVFNGNGYRISGLWINRPSTDYVGLFGYVDRGTLKNLSVFIDENRGVKGESQVGGIAGYITGNSIITDSYSAGNVNGYSNVGGIVGSAYESLIANSYSTGNVNGNGGSQIGGIAGQIYYYSKIADSYTTGNVNGNNDVGGIAGLVESTSTVTDSYSTGNVSGNDYVGGIVGRLEYGIRPIPIGGSQVGNVVVIAQGLIINSYSTGNVDGHGYVGGIAGYVSGGSITNSYFTGNINGSSEQIGGIVGYVEYNSIITGSYSTGNVNGHGNVGGIAGYVSDSSINSSYFTGNINVSGDRIGGIAGYVDNSIITGSYSAGVISGGVSRVGGIAGLVESGSSITNNAAINQEINASLTPNRVVGSSFGRISNNFALSTTKVRGDTRSSTNANGLDGVDKTDDDFKTQTTYSNATNRGGLGWSFGSNASAPWKIDEGVGYPYLYWQDN